MSNENRLVYPFLIIIFSLLIFFGLLRLKKTQLLERNLEKYINSQQKMHENFIHENFIDDGLNNSLSPAFVKDVINGMWSTMNSTCDSNKKVSNVMNININRLSIEESNNSKINSLGTLEFGNVSYDIIYASSTNLTASSKDAGNLSISILFNNKLVTSAITEKPLNDSFYYNGVASIYIDNNLIYKYSIYKINNDSIASDELCRIIQSKNILMDQPPPIYDFKTYDIIVNNYKFPNNFISISDWTINKDISNVIKNKYNGQIQFGIQRVFISPASTSTEIISYISHPILLNCIDGEQIPKTLTVVPFQSDKSINELESFFSPKATILFFFKFKNNNVTYEFADNNLIEKPSTSMKLKNGANQLMRNTIKYNDINTIQQVNTNNYEVTYLTRVNSDLESSTIFSFSEIYPLL